MEVIAVRTKDILVPTFLTWEVTLPTPFNSSLSKGRHIEGEVSFPPLQSNSF